MICPHGMPSPASCTECMADGLIDQPLREPPVTRASDPVPAHFAGHCYGCDLEIIEGQQIVAMSNRTWRHKDCA